MNEENNAEKARFLADIMCKRKGKKENIATNPGYWNNPEWKMFYKQQVMAALSLLKIYEFETINQAINHKKYNWIYSLRTKCLSEILEELQFKNERKRNVAELVKIQKTTKIDEPKINRDEQPTYIDTSQSLKSRLD